MTVPHRNGLHIVAAGCQVREFYYVLNADGYPVAVAGAHAAAKAAMDALTGNKLPDTVPTPHRRETMDPNNLPALIDQDKVFALARTQPRFKAGLSLEKAEDYLLNIASTQAANAIAATTLDHVEALYAEHETMFGPRPEDETQEDWEEALDAAANEKFAPFLAQTGHGWQGEYLDDCQLWEQPRRVNLAHSFGAAFLEGVLGLTDTVAGKTRKRSAGARLAKLGIDASMTQEFVASLGKTQAPEARAKTMAEATEIVHRAIRAYAEAKGDDLDLEEFNFLIEQAADEEDVLAASSVGGLDPRAEPEATVAAFRTLKAGSGTYTDDLTMMLFSDEVTAAPEPTPAQEAKAAKKQRAPTLKPTTTADTVSVPGSVLVLMAEIGGTDREMAELFGVQRPAYNKCKNGGGDLLCHRDRLEDARAWASAQETKAANTAILLGEAGNV